MIYLLFMIDFVIYDWFYDGFVIWNPSEPISGILWQIWATSASRAHNSSTNMYFYFFKILGLTLARFKRVGGV